MMTLYWSSRSPYVRKVMVAAHEAGLAEQIQLKRADVATVRPHPEVSGFNPLGKIPTLVLEDGGALFDSGLICEYFHQLRPEAGLFPGDPAGRLVTLRRQVLGNGLMDVLVVGWAERMRPDGTRSDAHVAAYRRKFLAIADALEAEAPELHGGSFSIGHIAIGGALDYADFRFADIAWREDRPQLARWQAAFAARPSVRATAHSDEY
jgi:glutathione S-transferase